MFFHIPALSHEIGILPNTSILSGKQWGGNVHYFLHSYSLLPMRRAVTLPTGARVKAHRWPTFSVSAFALFSHPLRHWCLHQRCAFSSTSPALLPEAHVNSNKVKSDIPLHMCTTSSLSFLLMDMQVSYCIAQGFPGDLGGEEFACHCRRCGLWSLGQEDLWRRKWQPSPVFLLGKSHEQRGLAGYSPQGCKRGENDRN